MSRSRAAFLLAFLASSALESQVTVVNMTPATLSGETHQDGEPNLAVDPANPLRMAASAFTPDPLGGPLAPIYVSTDGGSHWTLHSILPGAGPSGTSDITLRFAGTGGRLYIGMLRGDNLRLNVLRTLDSTGPGVTVLVDRAGSDQPYVQATTVSGGAGVGADRVYVGLNDLSVSAATGRTATIDRSLDAATAPAPAGFGSIRIESRDTATGPDDVVGYDAPAIRPVVHPDGTVYGLFYGWRSTTGDSASTAAFIGDVVVVRDDAWGSGTAPFTALADPGDGLAGKRVAIGVTVPWREDFGLGQQRLLASALSLAVDPRNSSRIWIAWADHPSGSPPYTLHVRRSEDRGVTWSGDLLAIPRATNPALAVNSQGKVGFLYQQLTGTGAAQRWETHLRRSPDGTAWSDLVLATTPADVPEATSSVYLGDYLHLLAIGKDFHGVFSANNEPDLTHFPQGVTYRRNANFTTRMLLANDGTTPVAVSIDPFYFKVTETGAADDFYVRDWTDGPGSGDTGLEPSTHPLFFTTSDVWNRRSPAPGPFADDRPTNEDAGNGDGLAGRNWAFARIRRNALPASGSKTVTAHFLVSKLGVGSNYADAGSTDLDLSFPGPDPTVTFGATDLGPIVTPPYEWRLASVSSTHLCLAVEISAPGDPHVAPSLRGQAPGWPSTDLRVIHDNNKAQRNMGLSTTPATGVPDAEMAFYGIAHNAATVPRTLGLRVEVDPETARRLGNARVMVAGGPDRPLESGDILELPDLQPGENRWVGLAAEVPAGREGEILPVHFYELVDGVPVNGFTIALAPASLDRVIRRNLELHRAVFTRIRKCGLRKLPKAVSEREYQAFVSGQIRAVERLLRNRGRDGDPFRVEESLSALSAALGSGSAPRVAVAHTSLLNALDSLLTRDQLAAGDVADILQTVRWHRDLFARLPEAVRPRCAGALVEESGRFIQAYGERKAGNREYASLTRKLLGCFGEAARAAGLDPGREMASLKRAGRRPAALQKAHRDLLLKLQRLADGDS